jgi:hypothetical protein
MNTAILFKDPAREYGPSASTNGQTEVAIGQNVGLRDELRRNQRRNLLVPIRF